MFIHVRTMSNYPVCQHILQTKSNLMVLNILRFGSDPPKLAEVRARVAGDGDP